MSDHKMYVLDTNVLLYDPEAIHAFPKSEIIVPISVIEEIDKFKGVLSETGNNARQISHMLDTFRTYGNLSKGIELPNKARLRVAFAENTQRSKFPELDLSRSSNRVLGIALQLHHNGDGAILVTQDTNLRVKANAFGLPVMHYGSEKLREDTLYTGIRYERVSSAKLEEYRQQTELRAQKDFCPYEGLLISHHKHVKDYLLFVNDPKAGQLLRVPAIESIWGVKPRNPEQELAIELLLNPEIAIVSLMGKAGTGKTLLALAAGLQLMLMENVYSKILVSRPIFPMGRDLGYLPGDLQEKLAPWMQPIFDNLELLLGSSHSSSKPKNKGYQELIDQALIIIEPLTYIRGRSIPHQYLIVDEAQNLTPHEMKTIITRAGEGTKIVLTGDPYQIDNPYVNTTSNGLSYAVERFKSHAISGHVTFVHGERSPLAELAANIL